MNLEKGSVLLPTACKLLRYLRSNSSPEYTDPAPRCSPMVEGEISPWVSWTHTI